MPNTSSSRKRVRQSAKRNALSLWRKRRVKNQTKAFLQAIQDEDVARAEVEFRKTCGILDRISCTSTLHKNTVARRKSRLSRRLADLKRRGGAPSAT